MLSRVYLSLLYLLPGVLPPSAANLQPGDLSHHVDGHASHQGDHHQRGYHHPAWPRGEEGGKGCMGERKGEREEGGRGVRRLRRRRIMFECSSLPHFLPNAGL